MSKAPCLNCPDRSATCHGECDKYKLFKEERDAENAERYRIRRGIQEYAEYDQCKYRRLKG